MSSETTNMAQCYSQREEQEIRVLMHFKHLYSKYGEGDAGANFRKFGEMCMKLTASNFGYELAFDSMDECYPPKNTFDAIRIAFVLTNRFLTLNDSDAKVICSAIIQCLEFEMQDIHLTQRIEREIRNKNLIVCFGASNVAFLDNSWGDGLLDYHACMSMMH